jgi:hypothetical protein
MGRFVTTASFLSCLVASSFADELVLKNGARISGVVVDQTATAVTLEVGPGRVTLPMSRVEKVLGGPSSLEMYRERAGRLGPADVSGWLALGLWAKDNGLSTQARAAYERVLALDPGNEVAHRSLGHVFVDNRWLSEEESYRARGLLSFEGQWVTPEERASILRERSDDAIARQARAEAEARAREAEARADAAEADARRAETSEGGIPLDPYVYGPGYGYGGPIVAPPIAGRGRPCAPYCPAYTPPPSFGSSQPPGHQPPIRHTDPHRSDVNTSPARRRPEPLPARP